jgi:hypothetical protein
MSVRFTNVRILIPGLAPLDAAWPSSQPLPQKDTFIDVRGSTHKRSVYVKQIVNVIEQDATGMWEFWLEIYA